MEEMEPTFRAEGYREKTADAQEKILILNLDLLGDNIVYSAFYRELRRAYPRAYITVVSKALAYSAMELCPYVNRVLRTDVLSDLSFEHNLPKVIQLCEEDLWPGRYTMTICSHWGPENKQLLNFLAYLSGAQKRIGVCSGSYLAYVPDWPGDVGDDWEMLLTDPLVTPAVLTHEAARALYAVTYLGFEIQDDRLEVWFGMEDVIKADKCLSGGVPENSIGVAIGIGSSGLSRKYPIEAYVRAMRQLLSHGPFYFVGRAHGWRMDRTADATRDGPESHGEDGSAYDAGGTVAFAGLSWQ